jgi:tetratricopeptide (TPR) repeat protein
MQIFLAIILATITLYANAQKKELLNSKEYSLEEQETASIIKEIENNLFRPNPNFDSLSAQLENIISKTPLKYVNSFEKKGIKYIKFWNEAEYEQYKNVAGTSVVKLQNVYPYAHYLLAIIKIERGLFKDAASVLNAGLKLEPDQPNLINELAFLYTIIGEATKDTSFFHQSNYLFEQAISSRTYNANYQKARSLRGIGYNLIELKNYAYSLKFYEKSLEYEESKNARNEIKHIKDKLSDETTNIYSKGTNLNKSDKVNSFEYFKELESKLPQSIKEKMSNNYVYLWSKASIYLSSGSESFRKEDYFNYPLKEWDISQIDAGVYQIVHYLKGVSSDYFIELNNQKNVEHLMLTFHFVKQSKNVIGENIFEITFEHKMSKEKITLFFKLKN